MINLKVHPTALLGPCVTIEHGATIGPNCALNGRTTIGECTTLVGGITLIGDAEIGAHCWLEANVSMIASSSVDGERTRALFVGAHSFIGAGSILNGGVRIGAHAWVEAGSVIARDIPPYAIVRGNPARIQGFRAGAPRRAADMVEEVTDPTKTRVAACDVTGVNVYRLPRITDPRGNLTFGEFGRSVPFPPQRYFCVFNVPIGELRGGHAQATSEEFIICLGGAVTISVDNGVERDEIILDSQDLAIYLPPKIWSVQFNFSSGSALMVFASTPFQQSDYITDRAQFLRATEAAA